MDHYTLNKFKVLKLGILYLHVLKLQQMMCNDHWHFLEIADVIHRLELTILKGAMESHSDNTWAHFIIEVSELFRDLYYFLGDFDFG